MLMRWLRTLIPCELRASLRRSSWANSVITSFVRKQQIRLHPHCDCTLRFDGHRCIGWATGGLESWECEYFEACGRLFEHFRPRVIWDIGANVGIWALFYAKVFPSVSTVIAYEPDAENVAMLRENIRTNELVERILLRTVALSDSLGQASFQVDDFTGSTGSLEQGVGFVTRYYARPTRSRMVAVSTMDHELETGMPAPQFVKIDVEGHEHALFRGAIRMLSIRRPLLLVEFSGPRRRDAVDVLKQHNYALLRVPTGERVEEPDYQLLCVPEERVLETREALAGK